MASRRTRAKDLARGEGGATTIDVAMVAAIVASAIVLAVILLGASIHDIAKAVVGIFT